MYIINIYQSFLLISLFIMFIKIFVMNNFLITLFTLIVLDLNSKFQLTI